MEQPEYYFQRSCRGAKCGLGRHDDRRQQCQVDARIDRATRAVCMPPWRGHVKGPCQGRSPLKRAALGQIAANAKLELGAGARPSHHSEEEDLPAHLLVGRPTVRNGPRRRRLWSSAVIGYKFVRTTDPIIFIIPI